MKIYELCLGYEAIHAYKYDCVLFLNEFNNLQQCLTCGESRYRASLTDQEKNSTKNIVLLSKNTG